MYRKNIFLGLFFVTHVAFSQSFKIVPLGVSGVSPIFRIPLFWLSFHNFPLFFYKKLAIDVLKKDGYLNIYFHPWEFSDIKNKKFKLPGFTTKNTGTKWFQGLMNFYIGLIKNT